MPEIFFLSASGADPIRSLLSSLGPERVLWSGHCAVAEYAFEEPASLPRWTLPEETDVFVTETRVAFVDPAARAGGEVHWPWPQHLRVQPGNRDTGRSATVTQIQLVCGGPGGTFPALVFAGGDLSTVADADRLANVLRQSIARFRVEYSADLGLAAPQTRMLSRLVIGPEFANHQGGEGQTVSLLGAIPVELPVEPGPEWTAEPFLDDHLPSDGSRPYEYEPHPYAAAVAGPTDWDGDGRTPPGWAGEAPAHQPVASPEWADEAPGWADEAPRWGDEAPRWGDEARGWGNEAPRWGDEARGWGNEAPGWGNEAPGWEDDASAAPRWDGDVPAGAPGWADGSPAYLPAASTGWEDEAEAGGRTPQPVRAFEPEYPDLASRAADLAARVASLVSANAGLEQSLDRHDNETTTNLSTFLTGDSPAHGYPPAGEPPAAGEHTRDSAGRAEMIRRTAARFAGNSARARSAGQRPAADDYSARRH